jgi:2-oxoglutarate ferredoxin oxidoreductase subunit alpha
MAERVLIKGNIAVAEGAIRAGVGAYFGYPITPQNEIGDYMARWMLDRDRIYIQAESELAAINMCYGASSAGARAMTSSSSPGISLKQEGISYAAGADVPVVIENMCRGGPGLGSISPAQSDYMQATRGGGHGDYHLIVLAPKSVQECADFTYQAFDLADKWRMPVMILGDGMVGQMMEACTLPEMRDLKTLPKRDWIVGGGLEAEHRGPRHVTSIHLVAQELEDLTRERFKRYDEMAKVETRFEDNGCKDADVVIVAYGTCARVALGAKLISEKEHGPKIGIFRPITLYPFAYQQLADAAEGKPMLSVEMSMGQLVTDVKLAALMQAEAGRPLSRVDLLTHSGGVIPTEEEVFARVKEIAK